VTEPKPRPGFPEKILLESGEVVDTDPALPSAAAFLDGQPAGARADYLALAEGIGVSKNRAVSILEQLEALGHVGLGEGTDERTIFDPDGPTDPTPL
jgi:hypothetical protein